MSFVPPTASRVEQNTSPEINRHNQQRMRESLARYENADSHAISKRIKELKNEWDTERVLEANAASIALLSVLLGFAFNREWFAFTGLVAAFLLQHSVQGWCPPLVPWRKAGVRTQSEIHKEVTALRLLRGDFKPASTAEAALAQIER